MRKLLAGCIGSCCLLSHGLVAAPQELGVDDLTQNAIQTAFQLLRRDYIRHEELTFEELNRAALQGLLERLSFGAVLETEAEKEVLPVGVLAEFVAPGVAYVRPESFGEGEGKLFAAALTEVMDKGAKHLVLDLRSGGEGSFDEAGLMLQCFMQEGQVMFKMRQMGAEGVELFVSKGVPVWTGKVVVLVDEGTGHAAEVMAAVLQHRGEVMMIGEKTRGATVRYTRLPLENKVTLRYANAEMLLANERSIFKKGLEPDFVVRMARAEVEEIMAKSRGKSIKPFLMDRPRPRYNEAALVHGGNPELDEYVLRSSGKVKKAESPLRDRVLQRAVDLLTVQAFLEEGRIRWKEAVDVE